MNWSELMLLLPVGVILGVATVVVFLDLVLSQKDRYILPWVALTGCVLAGMSAVHVLSSKVVSSSWFLFYDASVSGAAKPLILGGAFSLDTFGVLVWILACIAGGLSIISSSHNAEDSALSSGEYYGLTLLAVAGMMLLAVSHDFLTLLISLEIMSISTYILTASNRDDLRSNEAGLKYLVLGAFSTAILLMGIAFYYGATGSLSLSPNAAFDALSVNYIEWSSRFLFLIVAMGLIFVGALFKAGASPFHFWIPDVYHGAPTAVTGLMAVGVKAAAFAVIARVMFETFGIHGFRDRFMPLIEALAILTMIVGNILAMRQTNLKRMLAYSGIAHTGYLMLAFLLRKDAGSAVMADHLHSVLFYLFVYGIMTLGAFAVIGLLRDNGQPLEEIENFQGLAKEHPGVAVCMAIFMLSLAGLPPMGGFFAKFMIFRSAVDQGFVIAAVIGVMTSVASLYYYLRVIVAMYMSPSNATAAAEGETPARCQYAWGSNMLIYIAGVATLVIGMLPSWFYR